jgi:hypothetical protein
VSARDKYEHTRTLRIYVGAYDFGYKPVYDGEWLSDHAWEAARYFVKEWAEDNDYDLDPETEEQVRDEVVQRIEQHVNDSAFKAEAEFQVGLIQEWADEQVDKWSPTMDPVEDVRLEGGEIVIVITRAINQVDAKDVGDDSPNPRAWLECDAGDVIRLLQRASDFPDYRITQRHDGAFDRWQPDTGDYYELAKVAEQALKDSGWVPGEHDEEDDDS